MADPEPKTPKIQESLPQEGPLEVTDEPSETENKSNAIPVAAVENPETVIVEPTPEITAENPDTVIGDPAPEAASEKSENVCDDSTLEIAVVADGSPVAPIDTTDPVMAQASLEGTTSETDIFSSEKNDGDSETQEREVQEDADSAPAVKVETAPADFRFPTTNQTRHCFTRYIEYHRCIAAKGEDATECNKFAKYYRALCPGEWIERWNEQRENGTFPGPL